MNFSNVIHPCKIVNQPYEESVQSGLSYSPADMARLTAENRAVHMQELASIQYHDNLPPDAPVPAELRRGADENDLWNNANTTKEKLYDYYNKQKKLKKTNLEEEKGV